MADVFLSYSRVDTVKAMIVKESLEALGLEVFFDVEGLDSGDVFPDVLDREVKAAGAVLAVWSSISINRPWVKKECGIAMERGVLVPVQIEPISLMDKPTAFSDLQYQDLEQFVGEPDHIGWERTVRALAKTLKRPDLIKTRKKQVADKDRAEKLAARLKEKDAEMQRLKEEGGGGYWFKLWHGVAGLVALALSIGGAVWLATSMQAAGHQNELEGLQDLLTSSKLESFDARAPDAREKLGEILKDVPISALERASATDSRAALLLGWAYDFGSDATDKDSEKATELFRVSCGGGEVEGCRALAQKYYDVAGLFSSDQKLIWYQVYQDACEYGNMLGCVQLGEIYEEGEIVAQNSEEAHKLFHQACEAGELHGCAAQAKQYSLGSLGEPDEVKSRQLYERACAGGIEHACFHSR